MMKKIITLPLVAVFIISCSSVKKVEIPQIPLVQATILTNDVDSMSYALGVNMGNDLSKNIKSIPGGKSNTDLLIKGFTAAMKGDSTLIPLEASQTFFRNYITKAQAQESEAKKAAGEKFLIENKNKEGVQVTPSGLQYIVLQAGNGAKPLATDKVKVHYTGTLIDGTVFDSSVQRGEPIEFPLNQVIPGWTEGVQLMPVGSKYKFFVPYNLGYGEQGAGGVIPPYSTLIFDVELLDIIKEQPALKVEEVKQAPAAKITKKSVSKKK